jgi:hypothetical protein
VRIRGVSDRVLRTALALAVLVLLGAAAPPPRTPLPADSGQPAQIIAAGTTNLTVMTARQCAVAFSVAAAAARKNAEANADGLASRLGGSGRATAASTVRPLDAASGGSYEQFGARCEGGVAAAQAEVVRIASVPLPAPPSAAERARVSSLYRAYARAFDVRMRLAGDTIYAEASTPGADDRVAARIAADRARRAAQMLNRPVIGVGGLVAFERLGDAASETGASRRFFSPPPSTTIGAALEVGKAVRFAALEPENRAHEVAPGPYDTIAPPFDTVEPLRVLTVEGRLPADSVAVVVFAGRRTSAQVASVLQRAGMDARATREFQIAQLRGVAEITVAPPEPSAVAATVARVRAVLGDANDVQIQTRPQVESCEILENALLRAALVLLDARSAGTIALGGLAVSEGSCGHTEFSARGGETPAFAVTARMTVGASR